MRNGRNENPCYVNMIDYDHCHVICSLMRMNVIREHVGNAKMNKNMCIIFGWTKKMLPTTFIAYTNLICLIPFRWVLLLYSLLSTVAWLNYWPPNNYAELHSFLLSLRFSCQIFICNWYTKYIHLLFWAACNLI